MCFFLTRRLYPAGFKSEFKALVILAWPVVLTELWLYLFGPVSLIFCGHLGKEELDGASLAISVFNITGMFIGFGLCMACDTFFSQSFGSTNKKQVGRYLQKGLTTITLCILPCWTIHINAERILKSLGQDPVVSRISGEFLQYLMPGLIGNFFYQVFVKYLLNQNIIYPPLIIGAIANGLNALLQYLFVYVLEWGTAGSAVAQSIGYWLMFLLTLAYILVARVYTTTWAGWNLRDCLEDWWQIYRLAIPGILMVVVEWGSFEICLFLSGLLSIEEQATFSIIMQFEAMSYMIPLGVGVATSIRIGQHLGANEPVKAMNSSRVGSTLILITAATVSLLIVGLRYELPKIFTNEPDILQLTSSILPILAIFQFCDGIAGVQCGICRGTGRQIIASVIICVVFYLVAMPLALCLAFLTALRVTGMWSGLATGMFIEAILLAIAIWTTNWPREADNAQERAGLRRPRHASLFGQTQPDYSETSCLLDDQRQRPKPKLFPLVIKRSFIIGLFVGFFLCSLVLRLLFPVPAPAPFNSTL